MTLKKKVSTILAAGIMCISMVGTTFAADNNVEVKKAKVVVWKDYANDEKFSKAHAQNCFREIGLNSKGNIVSAYTQKTYVGIFSGYIGEMKIYNPKNNRPVLGRLDKNTDGKFDFRGGVAPYRVVNKNIGQEANCFKGSVKIKVMGMSHGDKKLDLVQKN